TSGVPENIVVKSGKTMAATQTSNLTYAGNLDAGALIITNITYTADPSGNADAVANNQAITSLNVTYTDGTSEVITSDTIDYSATTYNSDGTIASSDTMAGKSIRVGQNRTTNLGVDGDPTSVKTVASVSFSTRDAAAQAGTATDTAITSQDGYNATYSFTSGTFTIYDDTQAADTLTTQSVNVDGTNVIAATLTLSDGSTLKVSSGFYEIGHSVPITTVSTVYDAEGNMHSVTLLTDKADGNTWRTYISPTTGQKGYQSQVTLTESDGTSTTIYLNRSVDPNDSTQVTTSKSDIYFTELGAIDSAQTSGGSLYLEYSNGNNAQATTVAVDFNDITQYAGSNTLYPTTDGNSLGTLNSISIDVNGVITGTYTNGVIQNEAQIAVAQFVNSAGLDKSGTSLYKESNNSGAARVGTVGDFGFAFTPSALEMSNVELASELVDMIVTQRGFQANSKSITVGDEMLESIVNMKR
ncbi:MAG: flagellar hook-basal body complex protein, partial [Selenomonadaceae bacterium]|nr:flagellar hook-basal body complex protein [Selenomonadaceae bacterium]